jgi:hypothetical protein
MPDAPKNAVPRQSQKALSWWQKILLAVFGAYLAEKLFGILIPSLPHVSIPSTSSDTASTGDIYDNELPYRRAYEEDEEDQRDTSDDDAYADTYGGSAPYGGQYDEDEDILHNDWHDYGEGYDDDYFDD